MNERYRYYFCDKSGHVLLESVFERKVERGLEHELIEDLSERFELPLAVMYEGKCHHMCQRCRKIAIGQDPDILCELCAIETGHARFSKLKKREE